jgi:quinol monooxygenase YgiN
MSISFLGALAGTLAALVGAVLLIRLCTRAFRMDLVAFTIALVGLAVALAAQAIGYRRGFGPTTFRAAQLGAGLVAPLALCWGMFELTAKGPVGRFAARLCLGGLFVVAAVILATDVLSAATFSQVWPAARMHYEFLPLGLLAVVAVVVVGTVLGILATIGVRSGRDPRWRPALAPAGAAAAGAVLTQGLLVHLPVNSGYVALCLLAAVGAWLAGDRAARVPLVTLHGGRAAPGAAARGAGMGWGSPANGTPGGYQGDDSLGLYSGRYPQYDDSGSYTSTGGYGETGEFRATGGYGETGGFQAASGGYPASGSYPASGAYPPQASGGYDAYPPSGDFGSYPAGGPPESLASLPPEPMTGAFDPLYRDERPGGRGRPGRRGAGAAAAGEPATGMFDPLYPLPPDGGRGPGGGAGAAADADAGEPATGMFDPLYLDEPPGARGTGANGRGAASGTAAGRRPAGEAVEFATGMQMAALEEAVLAEAARGRTARDGGARDGGARDRGGGPAGRDDVDVDTERLYGQIAIYTLLEAGAAEFDRLSADVLTKVRTGEPNTLVYVVHQVPSAPLQRILYQVYRDRTAYDEHLRQPYITDFDARLRPLVLATNVIELGVSEAKVAALRARSASRGRLQ